MIIDMPAMPNESSSSTAGDHDAAAILDEMAQDPAQRRQLQLLQKEIEAIFLGVVDELSARLAEDDSGNSRLMPAETLSGARLARSARRAGMNAHERREIARNAMLSAVLNCANPNWDPADPSTDRPDHDDLIVRLLQMNLHL